MATSIPPSYAASPLPAHSKVLPAHSKGATQNPRLLAAALERRSLAPALDDGANSLDERPQGHICHEKSCTQTNTPTHRERERERDKHTNTQICMCTCTRIFKICNNSDFHHPARRACTRSHTRIHTHAGSRQA